MPDKVKLAFELKGIVLPLSRIFPTKTLSDSLQSQVKFKQIMASIREVGVIEPLIVHPKDRKQRENGEYIILDGHLRYEALKLLGETETLCLVAIDDESYSFNQHVNRVCTIQETVMLMNALDKGVSEEELSTVLVMDMARIRQKRDMLKGICPEAVEILKDKFISENALRYLKHMKPARQIEAATVMVSMNNYTTWYARVIFMSTPQEMLVEGSRPKEAEGISPEDIARIEREAELLEQEFSAAQDEYSENNLELTVAKGWLAKLIDNARVVRFLSQNYPEILSEFQNICDAATLEG